MLKEKVIAQAKRAKRALEIMSILQTKVKDRALSEMAKYIRNNRDKILKENRKDLDAAHKTGLASSLIDRLTLNDKRIEAMALGLEQVVKLSDPIGKILKEETRPNGLVINRVRVPLGLIGIIYESRPNVTCDAAGLCLKSGNTIILRGGSEAINSNTVIANILQESAYKSGIPEGAIQFIATTEREAVMEMIKLHDIIDVIIPRGGEAMIRHIVANSTVPVIQHGKGVCHTYIDKDADIGMAEEISYNAKVQRPGVCNAMETLLVHKDIANEFLPRIAERLKEANVQMRGCLKTKKVISDIKEATKEDWTCEYLDLILSIKVVDSLGEAIEHINLYGSRHSEAIVTKNKKAEERFLREVDAACVFSNASTRFTDGGEFGLGAEIGISTQKLHARGPMGLEELTSYKYLIYGNGQIRK